MAAAGRRVTLVAGAVGIFVAGCGVSLGAGERADRLPPSPAEVEAQVEPSMAAVATAFGRGSAFAIDGGYFVTTVDVVDPFDAVDLYLPGEPLLEDVPVAAVDLTADLAILGPVPGRRPPLLAAEDQDFARGDPLFLVGFPQEDGRPAIDAVPVRFDRYDATWASGSCASMGTCRGR